MKLCVSLFLIAIVLSANQQVYERGYFIDNKGSLVEIRASGYQPVKNENHVKSQVFSDNKSSNILENIPSYDWSYGSLPTSAAIISAYYDNFGADRIYTGPANGGVMPMTNDIWDDQAGQIDTSNIPLAASKEGVDGRLTKGYGDDYWTGLYNEGDPYFGSWLEHDHHEGQPCLADFMGTGQWHKWNNSDGITTIFTYANPSGERLYDMEDVEVGGKWRRDANRGWRLFFESLGIEVKVNFNQKIDGYIDEMNTSAGPVVGGYTFSDLKKSIDSNIPVLINFEGYSVPAYGYDESSDPPRIYIRNLQNRDVSHNDFFYWGGRYANMKPYSVSVLELSSKEYYSPPQNLLVQNYNRTVTLTWDDPSEGTRNVSYIVYRNGVEIATTENTAFSEMLDETFDGVHNYSIKAVYIDPGVVSGMSEVFQVYVCASVTSFYDDFEDIWNQKWIMNPESGSGTNAWGRATSYVYEGSYSLADSPGGWYANGSDQLPEGGHIAEVAPGLDFTGAADATVSFWINYEIEESFDYLHLQATEDGTVWTTLRKWSLESAWGTWNFEEIGLGMYAGKSNVKFRFIMATDPGYACYGAYIDNFSIQPSVLDTTPPFVYYEKAHDFHTDWPNGHWLETRIVDFTGIDYARILYKVNDGSEQILNPAAINGEYYEFQFPDLVDGDMVEFRFDCQDTYSPANQGYTGPFYYVHGLHQKYDYATVSYYTYVVTTTAQYDQKSYANKFNSFHDAVIGAVVRGYIDSTTGANNDMMMNVWANNSGVPGATMITPFAYPNPATLSNTNAWGYVNMSGYTALSDMEGDYFVGFECAAGGTGKTHTVTTSASESGEYDFKRAWIQYYATNGGSLTWEQTVGSNHHLRLVTTNKGLKPGTIEVSCQAIAETLESGSSSSRNITVLNSGETDLDFVSFPEYISFNQGSEIISNSFDDGFGGWTPGNTGDCTVETTHDGGNLNGTDMAVMKSYSWGAPGPDGKSYLTSPAFDLSNYGFAEISWIQKAYMTYDNEFCSVFLSPDGVKWTTVYTSTDNDGEWGSPDMQKITVPPELLVSNVLLRFTGRFTSGTGKYWAIDDVVVQGIPKWITINGSTEYSAIIGPGNVHDLEIGFNAQELSEGRYDAYLKFNSVFSSNTVLVRLNVEPGSHISSEILPAATALHQNYPNPFNPATNIKFSIAKTGQVELTVYNVIGQTVAKLVEENLKAGNHSVMFNADALNSGVYYYTLEADGRSLTKRMLMIK